MFECAQLNAAPSNLDDFVAEILPGFRALYGPEAADHYAATGAAAIAASIAQPGVHTFGCNTKSGCAALLMARQDSARATISFLHVLGPFRGGDTGATLLNFALDNLDSFDVFTEFVPFHPGDWDQAFLKRGFRRIDRQLMRRSSGSGTATEPGGLEFTHPGISDLDELAAVLSETYLGHPERFLFPEAQSRSQALDYLLRACVGQFGRHDATHTLAAWKEGRCAGFGIGCQVLPGLGFVLHLAVRPAFQGSGIGAFILQELSNAFAQEGLDYIALGVTCDNPAVNLYRRAGFEEKTRIPVYYRVAGASE